jgi:antigen flippase
MTAQSNHRAILRASFLTGGAQIVSLCLGLVRNKVVALCLGTAGVGLSAMLNQVFGIMQAASTLGIPPAGVRAVALSKDDNESMILSVKAVRYACVSLAVVVAVVFAAASPLISQILFKDYQHSWDLLVLVVGLVFGQMAAAEQTILRGVGKVGGLAKVNVSASAVGAVLTVPLVYFIGQRGIAPAILVSSVALFWFSRRASRMVPMAVTAHEPTEVTRKAWSLAKVGATFFGLTIIGMLLSLGLSVLVRQHAGIEGNGIYQAAVALTVTIASFVLSAMGQDFYPKIVHLLRSQRHEEAAVYCANQIEMGLLMAFPILAAVSFFSHELIALAYSRDFHAADPLVGVLAASCWARICYWPHMLCMLAEANATKILSAELGFALCTAIVAWLALPACGIAGVAVAYAACFLVYSLVVSLVVRRMTGRLPIAGIWQLYLIGLVCIVGGFYLHVTLRIVLLAVLGVYVVRRLTTNLGPTHRLSKLVQSIPLLRCLAPASGS